MNDKDITTDQERTHRSTETRDQDERNESWQPPSILPDPTPIAGYTFRWIRTSMIGHADNTNVSMKFREGWVP